MRCIDLRTLSRISIPILVSLVLVGWLAGPPPSACAQGISYLYDAAGRLIGVVVPGTGTAVYAYDAVGNLLSVTRYAATAVLIVDFSPGQGPVGTTVTISGVGFSATASQNTVRFNGTPVTVNGTNFEVRPTDNRLRFNLMQAPIATATPSVVSATVPGGGTSGRLTVSTPTGQAQGSDDFFIPPPGYTTGQVVFTGRLALGGATLTPSFATAAKIALAVFDGSAGQQVSLGIGGGITSVTTTIYNPAGSVLASGGTDFNGGSLHVASLPMTGTYTILVAPAGTLTGSAPLTLSQDLALGVIQINGASVNVDIARQGQRARLTFNGSTGQRLSIGTVNATRSATYSVLNPDGSSLVSQPLASGALTVPPLPATGTYTILIEPDHGIPMSMTLALSSDIAGSIVIGGAPVPVAIGESWQRARLTFAATAGQRLDLGVTGSTLPNWRTTFLAPNGSTVVSQSGGNGTAAMHTPPLAQTGTHTLLLEPTDPSTGTLTYTLSAEMSGSITPGVAGPVSITRAGQRARLTFPGTATQRVSLSATGVTMPGAAVALLRADGSFLASFFSVGANQMGFGGPLTLPASESYAILVDPSSPGDLTLTLYDVPPDITGSLTIDASPQTITFVAPGHQALLTLAGTAGQSVTIRGSNSSVGCFNNIALTFAGGGSSWAPVCGASFTLGPTTLGATATYTLLLDPDKANIGGLDIQVTSP